MMAEYRNLTSPGVGEGPLDGTAVNEDCSEACSKEGVDPNSAALSIPPSLIQNPQMR